MGGKYSVKAKKHAEPTNILYLYLYHKSSWLLFTIQELLEKQFKSKATTTTTTTNDNDHQRQMILSELRGKKNKKKDKTKIITTTTKSPKQSDVKESNNSATHCTLLCYVCFSQFQAFVYTHTLHTHTLSRTFSPSQVILIYEFYEFLWLLSPSPSITFCIAGCIYVECIDYEVDNIYHRCHNKDRRGFSLSVFCSLISKSMASRISIVSSLICSA